MTKTPFVSVLTGSISVDRFGASEIACTRSTGGGFLPVPANLADSQVGNDVADDGQADREDHVSDE